MPRTGRGYVCKTCGSRFKYLSWLANHRNYGKTCNHCGKYFCNRMFYDRHQRSIGDGVGWEGVDLNQAIQPRTGYEQELGFERILEEKRSEIRNFYKSRGGYGILNRKIDAGVKYKDVCEILVKIYKQIGAYRVSLGFGFVLTNIHTEEYRYYYFRENNYLPTFSGFLSK